MMPWMIVKMSLVTIGRALMTIIDFEITHNIKEDHLHWIKR